MQGRLAAGPIKRAAQDLPIDGYYALALLGKLRHEPLKRAAELIRVQIAKQPTERVVAGQPILQLEKTAQKSLFGLREHRHVHRTLAATQHRAQSNHQQFIKIVQTGIAAARVFQTLPTGRKLLQGIFTGHRKTLLQGSRFKPSYRKYHRWFGAIPNAIALTATGCPILSAFVWKGWDTTMYSLHAGPS
jgi:hypothetical protein